MQSDTSVAMIVYVMNRLVFKDSLTVCLTF